MVFAGLFCFGFAQSTIISVSASGVLVGPVKLAQELLYPGVLFGSALAFHRVGGLESPGVRGLIVMLGGVNFAVALAASFGVVGALPPFGDIQVGRYVFGTSVQSSSGLNFNVNYFAVTQAALFWFYGVSTRRTRQRVDIWILVFLAASSVWGSSRGVLLALFAGLLTLLLLEAFHGPRRGARRARWAIVSIVVVIGGGIYMAPDHLYDAFRLYKGLNSRDHIWDTGVRLWLERPLFGWGADVEVAKRFVAGALPEGQSLHSGYLHTLVRGGLSAAFFTYGFFVCALAWGLGRRGTVWYAERWPVAIVVFYLVNAAFRTYSVGGLGLLPALAALGLSCCLHARVGGRVSIAMHVDD